MAADLRHTGLEESRRLLDGHLAEALFNRGGRDFESIGLGWLDPAEPSLVGLPVDPCPALEALRSAVCGTGSGNASAILPAIRKFISNKPTLKL